MSQSAFFWSGDSFITTLMPASWARPRTGSSALPSFGMTPITSTFLAIRVLDGADLLRWIVGRRVDDRGV